MKFSLLNYNIFGHSMLLEPSQRFELMTPNPFSLRELGGVEYGHESRHHLLEVPVMMYTTLLSHAITKA